MTDQFHLALYTGPSAEVVPVVEYLEEYEKGEITWAPYLGRISMILEVNGHDYWGKRHSIGDLARIVVQLEAAHGRLAQNQDALVRSAYDDAPFGAYFLFEPDSFEPDDGSIRISMLTIHDRHFRYRYPVTEEGAVVEELYAFVASNHQALKQPIDEEWRSYYFADVPFPRSALLNSLQREARAGRRLYQVLDRDFYVELY